MASTYSAVADLKIGDLPLPPHVNAQKYVDDAADEIDSYLGYRYATPIDISDDGPVKRPARLMIKRIASHLSTGRVILAVAASSSDQNLHAYGKAMVDEALTALKQIMEGEFAIEGAESSDTPGSTAQNPSGPTVLNIDQFSTVEAFYQTLSLPTYRYLDGHRAARG